MIMKLIKEVCEPCCRPINIGQPILECEICNSAIHTRCHKLTGFCSTKDNLWACKTCYSKMTPRYNPYEQMVNGDTDKFYDRATSIWNIIAPKLKLLDYSHNISLIKSTLKRALLEIQHSENKLDWTESNFDMNRISISSKI